jgi:hypothetical protein
MAQRLQAAVAVGQIPTSDVAPVVALQLDANGQAILRRVHDQSDWVSVRTGFLHGLSGHLDQLALGWR